MMSPEASSAQIKPDDEEEIHPAELGLNRSSLGELHGVAINWVGEDFWY